MVGLSLRDPSGRNSLSLGSRPRKTPLVPHSQVPDGSPGMDETEMVTLVVTVMMQDEVEDDDHDCLIKMTSSALENRQLHCHQDNAVLIILQTGSFLGGGKGKIDFFS